MSTDTKSVKLDTEDFYAGVDCAMDLFCKFLGSNPKSFSWDAATEEFEGDVMSVLQNMFQARFGEDMSPAALAAERDTATARVAELEARLAEADAMIRQKAFLAKESEHDAEEAASLLSRKELLFQRDCDIVAARKYLAKKESRDG